MADFSTVASEELKIRAQIDQENVKAVLLINGGGAIALLAFLPTVLGKPQYVDLARSIILALLTYQVGLACVVVHNFLRRKCSQVWQTHRYEPPRCLYFKYMNEPCICAWAWISLAGSLIAFIVGGVIVAIGAFATLDVTVVSWPSRY